MNHGNNNDPSKSDKDREFRRELMRGLSLLSQFGITMVACVLLSVLLGRWLDGVFGTEPWLLLVFTLFGVIAAFRVIFDLGKRNQNNKESKK